MKLTHRPREVELEVDRVRKEAVLATCEIDGVSAEDSRLPDAESALGRIYPLLVLLQADLHVRATVTAVRRPRPVAAANALFVLPVMIQPGPQAQLEIAR